MKIVIIGNGIAGITAARHIRKMSEHEITVISAESKYFFSRTALMYIYMGHMKLEHTQPYENWFWEKNRIQLLQQYVKKVDTTNKKLLFSNGEHIEYEQLIIACGSTPNKFGWPGQDLPGVQGLYSLQDLELMEKNTKGIEKAVVVGGGLIGIEMVEMLLSRRIPVTFLVREKSFWDGVLPPEESAMINRHIREHHVDLRLATELKEILSDANGKVKAVVTKEGEEIACQFVGLTVGVHPNIDFLKGSNIETAKGILVNEHLETNIPDVYAIGDCAQMREALPGRRPIEAVWYVGAMQGETVAESICTKKTVYNPRIWFNSAKFFDIEYQTYGTVLNKLKEGEKQLYWEDKSGKKGVKIVYQADSEQVIGFNLFGVRFRHEVCEQWLAEKRDISHVLSHLKAANFDPELFDKFEPDLINLYQKQNPSKNIQLKPKRSLMNLIFRK